MKFFSGEKPKQEESLNPLKAEHLKEGVNPIIACIGTPEQFKEDSPKEDAQYEVIPNPSSDRNNNRNVNYYGRPEELNRQNFKNAGDYSYVIISSR